MLRPSCDAEAYGFYTRFVTRISRFTGDLPEALVDLALRYVAQSRQFGTWLFVVEFRTHAYVQRAPLLS